MMSSKSADGSTLSEYKVRIPAKNPKKSFHVMKFNAAMKIDPKDWSHVRMVRENNRKSQKPEDEMPRSGAGSEFGRFEREEARRKKYGMQSKVYDPDSQPWLMRIGSKKEGKTYRGIREGGVSDNATYYLFTHAPDGSFEAHPVKEWYKFTPRITHRTLNADEAEEKFEQRGKILNHWAVMVNKKLKPGQEPEEEDFEDTSKKSKKGKASSDLKISDMDDWIESGEELDSDGDEEDEDAAKKSRKKKKGDDDAGNKRSKDSKKKNRKKNEADLEGLEDSDDGDEEGREVDYMSDKSSDSEEELIQSADTKGVDQDEGLAKMLDSDESESEDENKTDDDEDDDDDEKKAKDETDDAKKAKGKGGKSSKSNSRATTPTPEESGDKERLTKAEKRKALVENILDPNLASTSSAPAKKARLEGPSEGAPSSAVSSAEASLEEEVRKYLMRKPITTKEILKKVNSKKTGLNKDDLMPMLVNVLKRINPHKSKVRGNMYLSIKATPK